MQDEPHRVQLSRAKGWKLPENTVSVARGPGRIFGNPFTVKDAIEIAQVRPAKAQAFVVECFDRWLRGDRSNWLGPESDAAAALILERMPELRGKNLACWCKPGTPCHADVLLEIVKRMVEIEAVYIDRDSLCRHAITNPRNEKAALASGLSDGANPTG